MRYLNLRTPMRAGFALGQLADGTWVWRELRTGGERRGGFATRMEALDNMGLFAGDRQLWPDVIDVGMIEPG